MKSIFTEVTLFKRKINLVIILWFALALIAAVAEVLHNTINNYLIFKQAFWHVLDKKNLYLAYPNEYYDHYFYGPVFSAVIAPFAVLPDWLGCILWCLANAGLLLYAITRINISKEKQMIILAITAIEMMTSVHNVQFNPLIGAWIILAFVLVEEENDFWGTFFIALGFLCKVYGIGALLFFVFSRHKVKFIAAFMFWVVVLICLPMLYSSPDYVITSYMQWFDTLVQKNVKNAGGVAVAQYQDISVMGMVRRMTNNPTFSNINIIAPAAICIAIPLLRFKQYAYHRFRLSYLAIILITVIIFSSGAESATYVVAVSGVGVWYIINYKEKSKWTCALLIFVFLLTILSTTDLFPAYIQQHFIRAYALKALPCLVVWLWLVADVIFISWKGHNVQVE
ncbi:MAG: hypothetical protein JWQ96_446 [Segetibacter sp.]|nr:hypothetical protein [Segetibacter sp.]